MRGSDWRTGPAIYPIGMTCSKIPESDETGSVTPENPNPHANKSYLKRGERWLGCCVAALFKSETSFFQQQLESQCMMGEVCNTTVGKQHITCCFRTQWELQCVSSRRHCWMFTKALKAEDGQTAMNSSVFGIVWCLVCWMFNGGKEHAEVSSTWPSAIHPLIRFTRFEPHPNDIVCRVLVACDLSKHETATSEYRRAHAVPQWT